MKELETDVLIVGAGPTGLALACDLQRRGLSFLVVERDQGPSQEPRSTYFQKRTLDFFCKLGLLEQVVAQGLTVRGVRSYFKKRVRERFEITDSECLPSIPYLLTGEQRRVESVLRTQLEKCGVQVKNNCRLTRLENEPERIQSWIQSPSGEEQLIRSRYLVGCDGSRSTVRNLSRIPMKGSNLRVVYRLAEVKINWELPADEVIRFLEDDWELVATPLPGGYFRLNLWEPAPYVPDFRGKLDHGTRGIPPTLKEFESRLQALAPGPIKLEEPRSLLSYRVSFGVAKNYLRGRILLAGDAAHLTPHSAAQGLNLGVQDAQNLGWRLGLVLKGRSPAESLERYEAERRQVAMRVLLEMRADRTSHRRSTYLSSRASLERWSELRLNYRSSSLHLNSSSKSTILAGDRAPNGLFSLGDRSLYLESILTGLQHHLLVFFAREDRALEDLMTALEARYLHSVQCQCTLISTKDKNPKALPALYNAVHGDLVLIRPDGFIELRASLEQTDEFFEYLERTFLTPLPIRKGQSAC